MPRRSAPTSIVDTLGRRGRRLTGPRRRVADLLDRRGGTFTAADLLDDAGQQDVPIGRATVFRSLDLFTDLGLLERIDLPSGEHAYVVCEPVHHHHVVCSVCGRQTEVDDAGVEAIVAADGTTDRLSHRPTQARIVWNLPRLCEGRMKRLAVVAVVLVAIVGCNASASPAPGLLTVVTTTTVFADLVQQVGGNRVTVHSLVPRGADVHTFDPAPSDAQAISAAKLIVMNGLGLDDWLTSVIRDAGAGDTPLLKLGDSLPVADLVSGSADEGGAVNPHLWMDVAYARGYVALIADQLSQVDPAGKDVYQSNLATYDAVLAGLDGWIRDQFKALPPEQPTRRLVPRRFSVFRARLRARDRRRGRAGAGPGSERGPDRSPDPGDQGQPRQGGPSRSAVRRSPGPDNCRRDRAPGSSTTCTTIRSATHRSTAMTASCSWDTDRCSRPSMSGAPPITLAPAAPGGSSTARA